MMRLMGILTGSAIAIAFLVIAFGIPELDISKAASASVEQRSGPEMSLPEAEAPAAMDATTAVAAESHDAAVALPEPAAAAMSEPPRSAPPESAPPAIADDIYPAPVREAIAADAPETATIEPQWYAFWSPFRSELAANGFVSQLQRTTGLDYRVVKLKPGVYEVAFAYSNDADIEDKLARIASATGLDLSGG